MDCIITARGPQWVLYHIAKQGGTGKLIESLGEALPTTPWDPPLTYVMTVPPPFTLPPWGGVLWVCNQQMAANTPKDTPDYCRDILQPVLGILDTDGYRWLMATYKEYPQALERLALRLMVMAKVKDAVLCLPDIVTAVPPATGTPFLWKYQPLIGEPQGLRLLNSASNSDLWGTFMNDGALMKRLKGRHPHLVYSLLQMRGEVVEGVPLMDAAIRWHLTTLVGTR